MRLDFYNGQVHCIVAVKNLGLLEILLEVEIMHIRNYGLTFRNSLDKLRSSISVTKIFKAVWISLCKKEHMQKNLFFHSRIKKKKGVYLAT